VEWADYECPHCARTAVDLKKLAARTPDLKILFRHYPLSPKCNENVGRDMHEHACAAARAAVCAQEQGLFWELNEMMFANQQYLAPDDLSFMAGQVGLDVTALQECMDDPATADAVKRDVDAGNKAGIYSTPSLFLKGVHPDGWIKVSMGPEAIPFLLDAVREGRTLPAARPPTQ
jgi:NhaA family Na+:H+ antiporter